VSGGGLGILPYWAAIALLMIGLYTTVAHRNLMKKLIGMTVFQTAIILFFLLLSVKRRATLPILAGPPDAAAYMNPLPHALMLTAIVVMVATTGVALAILVRVHARYDSIEEDVIAARVATEHPDGPAGP
jgi:multicomponent Na+:H+ antiporter subunit C